jgi:nucleoid DNA-binding protein
MKVNRKDIDNLPEEIRKHLRQLVRSDEILGQGDEDAAFERLAAAWIEKERLFTGQTEALDMEPAEGVSEDDEMGMLLLTSSGSLLSLWPARDGRRKMEYASIPLRTDVPEILIGDTVSVDGEVRRGSPARVQGGPIKQTSPVYRIARFPSDVSKEEQDKRVREATIFLTNGFTRINKISRDPEDVPVEHFTKQSMVAYIAQRSDLTQKDVRLVIDDYLHMVESGVLLGEAVTLGRLGRISIKRRPPQKARVGRNPATGEDMTIPAKPARGVPKISFSKHLKQRAAEVELHEEDEM